ncbi:MAG: Asp-tRNA(Asn)/Glu-tRNA(Gln) amidotransferase subunit GatB [Candidatus Pacebacteria bacterium]|jgi:aspartyl-tRNA(Asn)/glutamyl-tRNA(Gln) amidotransferase subunit B|nr:Asp-tRNA(Asn)/Glu-tRNA(Gln) amidotransferase subunit GatB [Candidatus Paceibacterota bacterium]MBP9700868.1 Asp-tRNA(Asn)/Glu-tRNA(Gln) amidotransferase subunit GatB [Candidatus Paceibacterota bacterium]
MKTYYPTIGLEIHAELATKSKMFCGCKNDPDEVKPNVNICPICMAHPGTLPVANKQAIENVIKVGLALDGTIADFSEFDRKHYFYPDIPKGYQISQYKYPIVSGGSLNGVAITRVHLEEDTANSKHDRGDFTLVDYNRAGVPLMELVTEPVIKTAKEAGDFARELQLLLRYLGVSDAHMEKGEMRVEANISLSDEEGKFGTKVEVKNLNSFRSAERAIEHELARMQALYEAGRADEIVQETRGWDENKQTTFSQRSKENANDYRYFPDPDLPKMQLHSAFDIDAMKKELPELPWQKRARYEKDYGLKTSDIDVFVTDANLATYIEQVIEGKDATFAQTAANYIVSDLLGIMKKDSTTKLPEISHFRELISMVVASEVTSRGAKDILASIAIESASPMDIAKAKGLLQENNEEALKPVIEKIIAENEKIVADYKAGKEAALQGLVGLVMKETKGSANPAMTLKLIKESLA